MTIGCDFVGGMTVDWTGGEVRLCVRMVLTQNEKTQELREQVQWYMHLIVKLK